MTLAFFVLMQYRSVTDGQTDGHLCSGHTSACIACYANALVKITDIEKSKITMLEFGSRQNMTDMDTKRATGKCIANALVCQLC